MDDLENLHLDIQLLTNDELDQYDDLDEDGTIGIGEDTFDTDMCEEVVSDIAAVVFPVSVLVQGKIIPCMKSVILQSEYLSNMAEMFENCEALPVPETVSSEDIKEISECAQILTMSDSPDFYMNEKLKNIDLEHKINLLIICDLLGLTKIKEFIVISVIHSVSSDSWKFIYSRCSKIMGLSPVLDHLLEYFLHSTASTRLDVCPLKDWTELVSFQFMERVLKKSKYDITEEIKFDCVMDWISCRADSEEELISLLSLIQFKCFHRVSDIQQAGSDLSQLGFLSPINLSEVITKCKDAISFRKTSWKMESVGAAGAENVLLLNNTKSEVPWPKLLGCKSYLSTNESDDDFLLLNDPGKRFSDGDIPLHTLALLRTAASYPTNISYKSSIFYIHYPNTNLPQLCQFNLDYKKCFHVLDLPLALRSINDQHRNRRNLVMICNVENYLYLFSKNAFSKQNFDSLEKQKVYRIDLGIAIKSCNEILATKNSLLLKWEHFVDIPEIYLEDNDSSFDYDIKAVNVGKDIFIVSNDLCISLDVLNKLWSEKELASPARNNPLVFGSDSELFVIGGTCMGQNLVSGQRYNTDTWKMHLLPSIPNIFPAQNLKHYKGFHFKNFLFLHGAEILMFDLFLNQWTTSLQLLQTCPHLFCLDRPVWL